MRKPPDPVPVPSEGVIVNRTGNYRYVHHVLKAYRDEHGKPTNDRVSIGTLVPGSETMMYPNHRYSQFYSQEIVLGVTPTLQLMESKAIGASFLVSSILQELGVSRLLHEVLGTTRAEAVLSISNYMACRGNVIEDIDLWCSEYSIETSITPSNASLVFSSISFKERMEFFKAWININKNIKYLAYDVTSFSTHAKSIIDSEFGYNRDGESLPQINLGCYLAYETKMPIFYTTYQGSIVDKSNLPYIMQYNKDLNINNVIFVMDRGFCSTSNIMWMHIDGIRYLIAV